MGKKGQSTKKTQKLTAQKAKALKQRIAIAQANASADTNASVTTEHEHKENNVNAQLHEEETGENVLQKQLVIEIKGGHNGDSLAGKTVVDEFQEGSETSGESPTRPEVDDNDGDYVYENFGSNKDEVYGGIEVSHEDEVVDLETLGEDLPNTMPPSKEVADDADIDVTGNALKAPDTDGSPEEAPEEAPVESDTSCEFSSEAGSDFGAVPTESDTTAGAAAPTFIGAVEEGYDPATQATMDIGGVHKASKPKLDAAEGTLGASEVGGVEEGSYDAWEVIDEKDTPAESEGEGASPAKDEKQLVQNVLKGFSMASAWTADLVCAVRETVHETIAKRGLFESMGRRSRSNSNIENKAGENTSPVNNDFGMKMTF